MNERIKLLAAEAWQYANNNSRDGDETHGWLYRDKFAELIVEECRYVMDCNKGSDQNPAWNQALSETSEKIKEHFGVEDV